MTETWQWHVFLADLDPATGSEQAGSRPVLVVSEEDYNQVMPLVTIVPLTTRKQGRHVYPNEVLLSRGTAGLTADSIVLVHQVRTISKRRLTRQLGPLNDDDLRIHILDALKGHLSIP